MEFYILKSGICLAIFYGFYKLVLEKESFHVFKRYYLLASVVLAFVIPLITFTEYIEVIPQEVPLYFPESPITNTIIEAEPINYFPIILWSIYGFGVLLFSFKFFKNLLGIIFRIRRNPKFKNQSFINVLLQDLVIPHTFFDYIFLNKQKFESHQIPKEVLLHEETHAKQKHSLDVLFIEILHILFWFNPFIYFIKRSIKLNHEFLADQSVINNGITPSTYQQILLAFSSNASEPQLANAINYSSIKKRFTVMKTQTSKKALWLRSFILLPLLAILIYSFSEKKVVERESQNQQTEFLKKNPNFIISISEDNETIIMNKIKYSLDDFEKHIVEIIDGLSTEERKEKIGPIIIFGIQNGEVINKTKEKTLEKLNTILIKHNLLEDFSKKTSLFFRIYDNETIKVNNKIYSLNDFENYIFELVEDLSAEEKEKIYPSIVYNSPEGDKTFEKVNNILRKYNLLKVNKNVNPDISVHTTNNSNQQKATPEEIKEYNTLIKSFNSRPEKQRIIRVKDKNRIEYIYDLMTVEQKKENEAFPNFLTVAPPPIPFNVSKNLETYINERKKVTDFIEKHKIDYPLGYLELSEPQQKEFMNLYNAMSSAISKLSESEMQTAPKILPPPPSAEMYKLENGKLIKKDYGSKNQQKATPEEIEEFNKIAKGYNSQDIRSRLIMPKDFKRMEYIFGKMTDAQKANAEKFPQTLPPPPPPVMEPKNPSEKLVNARNIYIEKAKAFGQARQNFNDNNVGNASDITKLEQGMMTSHKEYSDLAKEELKSSKDLKKQDVPPPPPPPVEIETDGHTKESLEARKKFLEKAHIYGEAMQVYFKEKKGNLSELRKMYDDVMVLYNKYSDLRKKENAIPPPPPPIKK